MSRSAALTSRVQVWARSRPPLPFIPTLIGLRAFDLVSSRVWWEATTNNWNLTVCVLFFFFFNSARAFVALRSWLWWKVPNRCAVKGCYEKDLLLTVVGVEPKEGETPVELLFIIDATWSQEGAAVRWNRITCSLPKFLRRKQLNVNTHKHVTTKSR